MKIDFYTKAVLTLIAMVLSVIALNPWIAPSPALGSPDIERYVRHIRNEVRNISSGVCINSKIC